MDVGHYADACPKLAESQRLDPGGGTQILLAQCYEKMGKTATAWTIFNEALGVSRKTNRADRERLAQERITALNAQLSKLTIRVAPEVAALEGFAVTVGGTAFNRAAFGTALPVDPGEQTIVATAKNRQTWTGTVSVGANADSKAIDVPMLVAEAPPPPPVASSAAPAASSAAPVAIAPPPAPPKPVDTTTGKRTAAYVIGGFGIVGLGVGSVLALSAKSKFDDSRSLCPTNSCPSVHAVDENASARSLGNAATVVFAAGVIGVGLGAYFFATSSPREPTVAMRFNLGAPGAAQGASLAGSF